MYERNFGDYVVNHQNRSLQIPYFQEPTSALLIVTKLAFFIYSFGQDNVEMIETPSVIGKSLKSRHFFV